MPRHLLGLIGGGTMAEALVRGLVSRKVHPAGAIVVSDPLESRREYLSATYGIRTTESNLEVAASETVILAVKPAQLAEVVREVAAVTPDDGLIVSIVAGATLATLSRLFGNLPRPIVRTMPNTCCTIGEGITAIAWNDRVDAAMQARAHQVFQSVGDVVDLPESYFDAVTGLSGSGPAYVTLIIESLIEAGVQQGLPRRVSRDLVCQTVAGAALLVKASGKHPAELKDQVVTPAGTTAAGLQVLEEAAVRATLALAVKAATQRSRELGRESEK